VAAPFCIPTSNEWAFLLLQHVVFSVIQIFFYSNKWVVTSHCCFILHLTNEIWYWTSFHMLIFNLGYLLWWSVCSVLLPVFIWVVSFCCWVSNVPCLFEIKFFIRCVFRKYFLPVCGLSVDSIFQRAEIFNFNEV